MPPFHPPHGAELFAVFFALLTTAAFVFVPGYVIVRILWRDADRLDALAAAPAVSAGVLYALGLFCTALHVPVHAWLGMLVIGLALLGFLGRLVLEGKKQAIQRVPPWLWAGVALGMAVGMTIWAVGIGHVDAVPPYRDGLNHGYFTARILASGSLDPSIAIPKDPLSGGHVVSYYPLALHEIAAMVTELTGVGVGVSFTFVSIGIIAAAMPLGLAATSRRLFPDSSGTAAAAGVAAGLTPALTYSASWWAGYPQVAGLALTAGTLALLTDASRRLCGRLALVGGLAIAGVAGVHTSELLLLILLVAGLGLLPRLRDRGTQFQLARPFLASAAPFVVGCCLLLPIWGKMSAGYADRVHNTAWSHAPAGTALIKAMGLVTAGNPETPSAVVVAFLVGFLLVIFSGHARAWLALWLLFAGLYTWLLAYPSTIIFRLTSFWYSVPWRLAYVSVFLAVPLVAAAVARLIEHGLKPHQTRPLIPVVALAAGVALAIAIPAMVLVPSIHAVRDNYRRYSIVDASDRSAFSYLARHVPSNGRVLNEHQDGSSWMYALDGVVPLIALRPDLPVLNSWTERNYVITHAADAHNDARERALLRHFGIEYAYIGHAVFPGEVRRLHPAALIHSGAWSLVFKRGGTYVFRLRQL